MLEAAVVLSNPWNLDVGNVALQRTWFGREVYSRAMGGSLKTLFDLYLIINSF
jgi:predicted alpha/beta-fold hydrolase